MDPDKTKLGSPLIVRSPLTGKVLDILAATGEFRNDPTAPLMTVADLSDIWVTANVQEKDIHFVHRGDPAVGDVRGLSHGDFWRKGAFRCRRSRSRHAHRKSSNRVSQPGWPSASGHVCHRHFENVGHKRTDRSHDGAGHSPGDKTTVFVQVSPNTYEQRARGHGRADRTAHHHQRVACRSGDKVLIREGALLQ